MVCSSEISTAWMDFFPKVKVNSVGHPTVQKAVIYHLLYSETRTVQISIKEC